MLSLTIEAFEKHTPFPLHSALSPQLSDFTVTFNRTHCGPHKSDTTVDINRFQVEKKTKAGIREKQKSDAKQISII